MDSSDIFRELAEQMLDILINQEKSAVFYLLKICLFSCSSQRQLSASQHDQKQKNPIQKAVK